MYTKLKKQEEGFSIIEVLIVLAIAGLIMLIVFLAVPALQRNSRNTQRRNDVSSLLGAVAEFGANNNGRLPDTITFVNAGGVTWALTTGAYNAGNNPGTPVSVGFFNTAGSVTLGACGANPCAGAANAGQAHILTNAVCNANVITNTGASTRNISVRFAVEPGTTAQCQQS